jgi:type II restriction enzyme
MVNVISPKAIARRNFWIAEIKKLSGNFCNDTARLVNELSEEIKLDGVNAVIDHLRLCGNIPEEYEHDSSEEKLYSKYTDNVLSFSFKAIGLRSIVLTERADAADVEAVSKEYSFVADAKAFRLSRTAKNQKDFKVQAMDGWKKGKPYAMVVCPIYQLPNRSSQIYQQASIRNICIFTYSHLALLVSYAKISGELKTKKLLHDILNTISALNPSKNAVDYWLAINKTILNKESTILNIWNTEKKASIESIAIAKENDLRFLASERERIMKMDHDEAIQELIKIKKIDSKIKTIKAITDNGLFEII